MNGAIGEILRAAEFAAKRHAGQHRKGRSRPPYVNHAVEVARLVAEAVGDGAPEVVVAALLHDTVEDTTTTPQEIAERFGAAVAALVMEVTDDKGLPQAERKRLQVEHAPQLSPGAKIVKIADKISNLGDILRDPPADWPVERQRDYFEWGRRVVAGCRGVSPRLESLFDETYAEGMRRLTAAGG